MPNANAIVSSVIRLDTPLEGATAGTLRAQGGASIELDDGRRVRLDPENPRSAVFAQVLDGLSRQKLPVYVEVDPATSAITRVLIPYVTRVADVQPSEDGLDVEIEMSHARHVLRRGAPDYDEMEKRLREALETGDVIALTEDSAHNIIDVRAFKPGPDTLLPPLPRGRLQRPLTEWRRPLPRRLGVGCISEDRAQQVFDAMAATSCAPVTAPPPCIPFMFPDDGCWARAHEMCRLMMKMGESPAKVWIFRAGPKYLTVKTRNTPSCSVSWFWHVAPTLCVRRGLFLFEEMVFDPSMFTTPVNRATWKAAMNNPGATFQDTDWTIFYIFGMVTDPTFVETNKVLAGDRGELKLRSQEDGLPPYARCS